MSLTLTDRYRKTKVHLSQSREDFPYRKVVTSTTQGTSMPWSSTSVTINSPMCYLASVFKGAFCRGVFLSARKELPYLLTCSLSITFHQSLLQKSKALF